MAYPVDPARAKFNTNVHDAFGVDTGGRKVPHTGIDFAGSGPVNSVYGGEIMWNGYDTEAGNAIVINENDGAYRGYGHMLKGTTNKKYVGPGEQIGSIGATGTGAKGAHLHMWEASTLAAALRILNGYVNYKSGQSTQKWADGMGLRDPMPAIQKSLSTNGDKNTEGLFTVSEIDNIYSKLNLLISMAQVPGQGYGWDQANSGKIDALSTKVTALQADVKKVGYPDGMPYTWGAALNDRVAELKAIILALQPSQGTTAKMTDEQVEDLGRALTESLAPATLDLLAQRIQSK